MNASGWLCALTFLASLSSLAEPLDLNLFPGKYALVPSATCPTPANPSTIEIKRNQSNRSWLDWHEYHPGSSNPYNGMIPWMTRAPAEGAVSESGGCFGSDESIQGSVATTRSSIKTKLDHWRHRCDGWIPQGRTYLGRTKEKMMVTSQGLSIKYEGTLHYRNQTSDCFYQRVSSGN